MRQGKKEGQEYGRIGSERGSRGRDTGEAGGVVIQFPTAWLLGSWVAEREESRNQEASRVTIVASACQGGELS